MSGRPAFDLDTAIGDALVENIGRGRKRELEFYQAREVAHAQGMHADEVAKARANAEDEWRRFQRWRIERAAALVGRREAA